MTGTRITMTDSPRERRILVTLYRLGALQASGSRGVRSCRILDKLIYMRPGAPGVTYLVGAREEHSNIMVVTAICDLLDARLPLPGGGSRRDLIGFVTDRQGHDRRYAVDPSRIERELDWRPRTRFVEGLAATVDWYLQDDRRGRDPLIGESQ